MSNETFTFQDLFSGIGGFHIALSKLGGKCIGFSEIDKKAIEVYKLNFPKTKELGDVTKIDPKTLPDFDVIAGGFPCQTFSNAGNGLGMKEARGTLFFEIMRIIKVKRPKIFILENVKALINKNHEHEFEVIIHNLKKQGYCISDIPFVVSPNILYENEGGRPQERESNTLWISY